MSVHAPPSSLLPGTPPGTSNFSIKKNKLTFFQIFDLIVNPLCLYSVLPCYCKKFSPHPPSASEGTANDVIPNGHLAEAGQVLLLPPHPCPQHSPRHSSSSTGSSLRSCPPVMLTDDSGGGSGGVGGTPCDRHRLVGNGHVRRGSMTLYPPNGCTHRG
jgi:hypothetical protein